MTCWERDHDWVVERTRHHQEQLSVSLPHGLDTTTLQALRALWDEFRHTPPAALKSKLGDSKCVDLGTFDSIQARRITEQAATLGLATRSADRSFVSYLPFDRTTGTALLIEDESEA